MYKTLLVLISVCLFTAGEAIAKVRYKAKGIKPAHIDSLYFFQPVSRIGYVYDQNRIVRQDSFSAINNKVLSKAIASYAKTMKIIGPVTITDTRLQERVDAEIQAIMNNAERGVYLEDMTGKSIIDSIMDARNQRFAMILYDEGYIRSKQNLKEYIRHSNLYVTLPGRITPGYAVGALDKIGADAPVGSNMYVMLIDARENKTCYYNHNISGINNYYHPHDYEELRKQLYALFEGFYFEKAGLDRW